MGGAFSNFPGQGGGGAAPIVNGWELVAEAVTVANVTQVTFLGLDINTDGAYFIVSVWKQVSGGGYCRLFINNDLVNANYRENEAYGQGTGVAGWYGEASPYWGYAVANKCASEFGMLVRDVTGYARIAFHANRAGAAVDPEFVRMGTIVKTATVANITRIDFLASAANSIGIGSRFMIFRRS